MEIVLASASPRRYEILRDMGVEFRVRPAQIDEESVERRHRGEPPESIALAIARAKADAVCDATVEHPVLAADTVVWVEGASLGKPRDAADAVAMLEQLSGRVHIVSTGIVLATWMERFEYAVSAKVSIRGATRSEVEAYVSSGEPLDKAGGYAIQGFGRQLVTQVDGCYLTVVGFPLCAAGAALNRIGIHIGDPIRACSAMAVEIAGDAPFPMPSHPTGVSESRRPS